MPTDSDSIIIEQQEEIKGLLLLKLSRKAKTRKEFQKLAQKYGYQPKKPSWLEREVLTPARGISLRHIPEHFRPEPKAKPTIKIPKEELTKLIPEPAPAEAVTTRITRAMARPEPTMRAREKPAMKPSILRAPEETGAGLLEANLESVLRLFKFPVSAGLEVEKTLKPLGKKGLSKYIPKPTTQTGKWFWGMAEGLAMAPVELASTLYQLSQKSVKPVYVLGRGWMPREEIAEEMIRSLPEQAVKVMIGKGMLRGVGKIAKGARMGWGRAPKIRQRLRAIEEMEIPHLMQRPKIGAKKIVVGKKELALKKKLKAEGVTEEGVKISPKREVELKTFADRSIAEVEKGRPAGRTFVWPEAGERGPIAPKITADASTYPQWYRDLTRDYSIKKSQTIKALKEIKEKGMEADGRQYVEAVKKSVLEAMTEERSRYAQEILKERAKRGVLTDVEKELYAFFEKKGKEFRLGKLGRPSIRERLARIEAMEIPPSRTVSAGTPQDISMQNVMQALKEARPVRKMQEMIYKKEKGRRLARALAVGEKVRGEAGFYAEKAQFKGELTKVQFESIRGKVSQTDINNLFNKVKDSAMLGEWEKLPAREGLLKLFGEAGGRVPTTGELALLERVFPSEFIEVLMTKRPLWRRFKEAGLQLANIPRAVMASFDLSFGGRQGAFAAPSFRRQFFDAWKKQFKIFASEKAYRASQEALAAHPDYMLARKSRVSFTEVGKIMRQREEPFASQWAEKIPIVGRGIRMSGRAYTAFANKFRMDMFSRMIKDAEVQGLKPRENAYLANRIADFVNTATGRGSIGSFEGAALALNAVFFSPRLVASRLKLLISPIYYLKEPAFVRRQALKSLFAAGGTAATVMALAKLGGAEVGIDPRSADFGKIKIGNTRIDVLAGFGQYIRPIGQIATGLHISSVTGREIALGEGYKPLTAWDILLRSIESKEAPLASFVTELMKGRDYQGRPLSIPRAIGNRFVPMVIGDMVDIYKENPELLPLSVLAVFGMGMQTYESYPPGKISIPGVGTYDWESYRKLTGTQHKEERILRDMAEDFIKSGLELEGYRRTEKFAKTLADLQDLHKDYWNDEMGSVLTTYMLNRFNNPVTVKRWVANKSKQAKTDEEKMYWSNLLKFEVLTWEMYKTWGSLHKSVKFHTPETINRESP